MNNYHFILAVKIAVVALLTILYGNGCVVFFNKIPLRWFCDKEDEDRDKVSNKDDNIGKLPEKLIYADQAGRQRLPSTPWKYIFAAFFGITGVFLAVSYDLPYLTATLTILAILLEMAVADAKYMVVPDQLAILLAAASIGLIGTHDLWWEPIAGAAAGLAAALAVWGIGRIIYKHDAIGGADLKFYIAIGLSAGREGIVIIFVLTTIITAVHSLYRLLRKNVCMKDSVPMLPYAFIATTIYFLFLREAFSLLEL